MNQNKTMVISIGDAGIKALKDVKNSSIELVFANTDRNTLEGLENTLYLNLENAILGNSDTNLGKFAAQNSLDKIKEKIKDVNVLILVSCLGGSIGSGALPIIAKTAKEQGILTVGIVTTPFSYEGKSKNDFASQTINELENNIDSLFIISNNRLINNYPDLIVTDAFKLSNNILKNCVNQFSKLIDDKSVISNFDNSQLLDFFKNGKQSYMGFGNGFGKNKVSRSINGTLNSKIVDSLVKDMDKVVLNIVGDKTVSMQQINEIIEIYKSRLKTDVEILYKFTPSSMFINEIQITLFGINNKEFDTFEKSFNQEKIQRSQELLIEIEKTLENHIKPFTTGEIDLEPEKILISQFDDKGQEDFFISSEESNDDDDIPFFLK